MWPFVLVRNDHVVAGYPDRGASAPGPQELLQRRTGGPGAGRALVDVHGDGEVALGGDHPGVGEGPAVALELGGAGLRDDRRARYVKQPAAAAGNPA